MVAIHYQEEAAMILEAEHEARMKIAKDGGSGMAGPGTIALPEF